MIDVVQILATNGPVPLRTGEVFYTACDARFEGEGLKKFENPPIFENEIPVNLFVEAIRDSEQWVDTLLPGRTAVIHLIGYDAKQIVATKVGLKTHQGQYVCIG